MTLDELSPGARLMLGMAIGDAFGARFENTPRTAIDLAGEEETYAGQNRYTDDTQMAIGVAELLVSGLPLTPVHLAEALLTAYRRDPRHGYSALTRRMLEESHTGEQFLDALSMEERIERRSDGAAMRAPPLGMLPDRNEVIRIARLSAEITHGHPDARAATIGIALIIHERYHHRRPFPVIIQELPDQIPDLTREGRAYLEQVLRVRYNPDLILQGCEEYGVPYTESLILLGASAALLSEFGDNPAEILYQAVMLGGDTDTTAAIVLSAALLMPEGTLPESLISGLENGDFGKDFLITLGDRLSCCFPVISS